MAAAVGAGLGRALVRAEPVSRNGMAPVRVRALLLSLACGSLVLAPGCTAKRPVPTIALSPDGSRIVFAARGPDAKTDLYSADLGLRRAARLTDSHVEEVSPEFCLDGSKLVYYVRGELGATSLHTCRSDGAEPTRVLDGRGDGCYSPVWLPDGRSVAFIRASGTRQASMGGRTWAGYDVSSVDTVSGAQRSITRERFFRIDTMCLANGGRDLAFTGTRMVARAGRRSKDVYVGLFVVPAGGKRAARLIRASEDAHLMSADARPDGMLAWYEGFPSSGAVWTARSNGTDAARWFEVDRNRRPIVALQLSATGDRLYFVENHYQRYPGDHYELWVRERGSGRARRLAGASLFRDPLKWRGD